MKSFLLILAVLTISCPLWSSAMPHPQPQFTFPSFGGFPFPGGNQATNSPITIAPPPGGIQPFPFEQFLDQYNQLFNQWINSFSSQMPNGSGR